MNNIFKALEKAFHNGDWVYYIEKREYNEIKEKYEHKA